MKKLTNVSPFLLLLVPVFVMMLLTFATSNTNNQNEEVAMKSSPSKVTVSKVTSLFTK
ncbi:MAG TPA: hypothetical protein VK541_22110 [Pedobacter sp.]|uniref:hypothetical protein n=1 Tax=Pedobacter sp. TaxID=1411316 RepID=UPI002C6E021C|nr:hypothetical protein [Pedobacter sp.]HMI05198.1 hypothetical protein [Pedobacter sp.]